MVDIVNGLLLRNGHVLMAHRSPKRRTYADTWSFPGGHVETGESLEQTLVRELSEEIGVIATSWSFMQRFDAPPNAQDQLPVFHFFLVEEWEGEPANIGNEHAQILWVALEEAARMEKLTFPVYIDLFQALTAC